jgi:hypothetical protein
MSHMCRFFTIGNRKVNYWSSEGHRDCLTEILSLPPHSVFPHTAQNVFSNNCLHSYSMKLHPCINIFIHTFLHLFTLLICMYHTENQQQRQGSIESGFLHVDRNAQNFCICYGIHALVLLVKNIL